MRVLVTGGAGFIGSSFIRILLDQYARVQVVNLDLLTYAGNPENLADVADDPRYRFVHGDVADAKKVRECLDDTTDWVVNFAAESHVDRSILDSAAFVRTNIVGTHVLLEESRKSKVRRFLQVSTDEVYGALGPTGFFREDSPLTPNSPYAASKAAADLLVRSYHQTYGMDILVSRCGNNYGPRQFPEKLIPLMILNAIDERELPVYGDGLYSRDWIHVEDHCRALCLILERGQKGQVYNVGADQERTNLEVVHRILDELNKPRELIQFVTDRPGHDRRYALDTRLLTDHTGWKATIDFETGLRSTIQWYREHSPWVSRVQSGDYRHYYRRMYDERDQTLSNLQD